MNKRRLLKLADFVETIPRKDFDMKDFGEIRRCGFVGCAMGHAASSKLFRGLGLVDDDSRTGFVPQYKGEKALGAAMALFDVSLSDAGNLFYPGKNHNTPKQVARNIRHFVKTGALR